MTRNLSNNLVDNLEIKNKKSGTRGKPTHRRNTKVANLRIAELVAVAIRGKDTMSAIVKSWMSYREGRIISSQI